MIASQVKLVSVMESQYQIRLVRLSRNMHGYRSPTSFNFHVYMYLFCQRIEAWWSQFKKGNLEWWRDLFKVHV